MEKIAIEAHNLSKLYRLGLLHKHSYSFRNTFTSLIKRKRRKEKDETIWALKNFSFEIKKGEAVGIIGRNGSGKTTLLKILSRITTPTEGYAFVKGRTGSLLEVGTGFHPELTGKENIYLNGAILGMKKNEIRRKFESIVEFAEIQRFIDTPVKRYSSGMYVRLEFAVAAHLEPEILLIDEVLAVGDATFQKKCIGKMGDIACKGRTILFVSHNMSMVQALCKRCILIQSGKIVCDDLTSKAISEYLNSGVQTGVADLRQNLARGGNGRARFTRIRFLNKNNQVVSSIPMGQSLKIEFTFDICEGKLSSPEFGAELRTSLGQPVLRLTTHETIGVMPSAVKGGTVMLHIERLDLMPGIYNVAVGLSNKLEQEDLVEDAIKLEITPYPVYQTGMLPPSSARVIMFAPCSWSHNYQ